MSSWTRTIVVPLSIISAFKPIRHLPPERGIAELFRDDLPRGLAPNDAALRLWTNLFLGLDRVFEMGRSRLPRPGAGPASPRRTGGCSNISRTPTAWARSFRR